LARRAGLAEQTDVVHIGPMADVDHFGNRIEFKGRIALYKQRPIQAASEDAGPMEIAAGSSRGAGGERNNSY